MEIIDVVATDKKLSTLSFPGEEQYRIPMRYRKMENLHIVFWLFKDISWCMSWRFLGIAMIVPTLIIAIVITWRTRHMVSEWAHNLAIVLWISANSYWMISEFYHFDEMWVYAGITYKHLAVVPFVSGILLLAWFYLLYAPTHKNKKEIF